MGVTSAGNCWLFTWRLERCAGEQSGWLACCLCDRGHVHFAAWSEREEELRRIMARWESQTRDPELPPLPIKEGPHVGERT